MLHLSAWATAAVTVSTDTYLTALADSVLAAAGSTGLISRVPLQILAAYAGATGATADLARAAIESPTLQAVRGPWIRPISSTLPPPSDPHVMDLRRNPLVLPAGESLRMQVVTAGAGDSVAAGLVWLANKFEPVPPGPSYRLRFILVAATDIVRLVWSTAQIRFEEQVPGGLWAMTGMNLQLDTAFEPIAARAIIPGQFWRPGCLAQALTTDSTSLLFNGGELGIWATFDGYAMPSAVELLANVTGTVATDELEGYIDIVQIADASGRPVNYR